MSEILVIVWCQQRCQIVSREEHGTVSWANPGNVSPPYGASPCSCPASFDGPLPCPHICPPPHCHLAILTCLFSVIRPWRGGRGQGHAGFCRGSRAVQSLPESVKEGCAARRVWALTRCPCGGFRVCSPAPSLLSLSLPRGCRVDVGTLSPSWARTMATCLWETRYRAGDAVCWGIN